MIRRRTTRISRSASTLALSSSSGARSRSSSTSAKGNSSLELEGNAQSESGKTSLSIELGVTVASRSTQSVGFVPSSILWVAGCAYELTLVINRVALLPDNVYHESDPVAFALNPCVDVRYSKLIKPVPIPSSNQTLLQNLSSAYYRVSKIFDFSSLWGSNAASTTTTTSATDSVPKQSGEQAKEQTEEQQKELDQSVGSAPPKLRPGTKRMPSEMPKFGMGRAEFEWVGRAEKRMKGLNPSGTVDYFLPAEGCALFSLFCSPGRRLRTARSTTPFFSISEQVQPIP